MLTVAGVRLLAGSTRAAQAPAILPVRNPNEKLQVAVVGLGGISRGHTRGLSAEEHLVAVCECVPNRMKAAIESFKEYETLNVKPADMKQFLDYREMLDALGGRLDAVVVCTPDHNHAIIGMDSMKRGKHVFIEKPMAHRIGEAIALRDAGRTYKVATQMGNEGHSGGSIRTAVEYIQSGAVGLVTEVHHWCSRPIGGDDTNIRVERNEKPPPWHALWSVPVPEEEANLRYVCGDLPDPLGKWGWGWRGERRWGTGALGDWGAHTMDVAYWGLEIDAAPRCTVRVLKRLYGGDYHYYKTNVYEWKVPARADMPELTQYWYDGILPNTDPTVKDEDGNMAASVQNMPPKVLELQKKYNRDFGEFGSIFVGEKGYVFTGGTSGFHGLVPRALHKATPRPEPFLPRAKGGNRQEWLHAIRTGEPSSANFEYAAGLVEHMFLGLLAHRVPVGEPVEYDRAKHRVTSKPDLNRFLTRPYRKGYEV
jgi:hypothetical protein